MPVFAALIENFGPSNDSLGLISSRISSPRCTSIPMYLYCKEERNWQIGKTEVTVITNLKGQKEKGAHSVDMLQKSEREKKDHKKFKTNDNCTDRIGLRI